LSLNKEQIKYLAVLSRMDIKESETKDVVEKLSSIIEFVDQLQAVTTDDTEPMAHPLEQGQRLRIDKVTENNERDKIQSNAKSTNKGMYLVPKVID
jgi:aspartyl-tRNA(Asn)/glutamyl-tRNA(Gln) amidotransferase subunit C|tara:strand:+ start:918 stop:1205 length:288 start_codon:yes stop_codon:yes gene_type:complete